MVNLTIDNINVSVPEGTTIMDAAKMADIPIPKLCYLKDINEIAACRVCVVELEGMERLVTSCNNVVKEGMVIQTAQRFVQPEDRLYSLSFPSTTANVLPVSEAVTVLCRVLQMT